MNVRFTRAAQEEVQEARAFYSLRSPRARAGFNSALRRTVRLLRQHPLAGEPEGPELRAHVLAGYPYVVYYGVESAEVIVYAVFHTSRDPSDRQAGH